MALVHFQAAADPRVFYFQLIVAHFYAYGLTGPVKLDIALRYANLALSQERKSTREIIEYEQLIADQAAGKGPFLYKAKWPSLLLLNQT